MKTTKRPLEAKNGAVRAPKASEAPMSQEPEIVPVEDDRPDEQIVGIDDGKKALANIGKTVNLSLGEELFTRDQILSIRARTPRVMTVDGKTVPIVKRVPIGGGKECDYVPVAYYHRKLNFTFGYAGWSFDVTKEEVVEDHAIVKGVLTVYAQGREIRKSSFGGHPIAREIAGFEKDGIRLDRWAFYKQIKKDEQGQWTKVYGSFVDPGNSFKAAATDCFKKCASMFGFFSDIYAPDDFVEIPADMDGEKELATIQSMIRKADAKTLKTIAEKIRTSDKYTDVQKETVIEAIDARMKTLPDGEPVK